ncbi:MAG: TRAP transporter small permease [Rhodospirillaceae bacterium]|jgi:TRAP-type mannitol/chloroaromatic compound transport system permease small subunit|nr:TRAP transporter small permease [Rhodospirillaceae bacterium]MBT5459022.1 TRAP transporter small permease [Rhodospirillaceae bacterium]
MAEPGDESGDIPSGLYLETGAPPPRGALSASLEWILNSLNGLGSIWIFVLMILINLDAFGRTFFAHPIEGVVEIVEMSIVAIVFLQLGDATQRGRLTRSDGLFQRLLNGYPGFGRFLGAIFDLLGIIFMAIVLYGTVPEMIEAVNENLYYGSEGVFTAPKWPVYLIILIGGTVTLLQFLRFAYCHLWIMRNAGTAETPR